MENKLKLDFPKILSNIPIIITATLATAYFGVYGYYKKYGIDIASYLTVEDLITIYVKNIWLIVLYGVVMILMLYIMLLRFKKATENYFRNNVLNKTIGNTNIKWRIVPFFLISISIIVGLFLFSRLETLDKWMTVIVWVLFSAILIGGFILLTAESKSTSENIAGVVFLLMFTICGLPYLIGYNLSDYLSKENIELVLDEKEIIKSTEDLIFIGKTHDYFFFHCLENKENRIIPMSEVKEIIIN